MDITTLAAALAISNKNIAEAVSELSLPIIILTSGEFDPQTGVPTIQNPQENVFYLVPTGVDTNNLYEEWIYTGTAWERFGAGGTIPDMTNYYTKTQADALLADKADASDTYTKSEVDTAVDGKASRTLYNATIPATGWTAQDGLYVCNVAVNGILPTDSCGGIGPVQTGTEATDKAIRAGWNKVVRISAAADAITVYASAAPTTAIPILLEVFR